MGDPQAERSEAVGLYVDDKSLPLISIDAGLPFALFFLDTRAFSDGPHRLDAVVKLGSELREAKATITIHNAIATPHLDGQLVDVTSAAGLGGRRSDTGEAMTGAVAADFDGDGRLDLFTWTAGKAQLYAQRGPFTFVPQPLTIDSGVHSVAAGDLDGDGRPDLVAAGERVWIFHNVGGQLMDVTDTAGLPSAANGGHQFMSITLSDVDMDGQLDVGIAEMNCEHGGSNLLLRNEGDFHFTDIAEALSVQVASGATYAMAFDQLRDDGVLDAWTFEEGCTSQLTTHYEFQMTDGLPTLMSKNNPHIEHVSPMGSSWLDLDGDGRLEVWMAGDILSEALVAPDYFDTISANVGLDAWTDDQTRPLSGWSPILLDVDMDSKPDLLVVRGSSTTIEEAAHPQHSLYWRNPGGVYQDIGDKMNLPAGVHCRAAQGADLDNDGDTDVLLGCNDGLHVLRNDLMHAGLGRTVVLHGLLSNPDGVNARLTAPSGEQRLVRGGGQPFASGVVHDSIAASNGALAIHWPSGLDQTVPVGSSAVLDVHEPALVSLSTRRVPAATGGDVQVEVHPDVLGSPTHAVNVTANAGQWSTPLAAGSDGVLRGTLHVAPGSPDVALTITVDQKALLVRPRVFVR